jgi:conjugative transposon TraN protein
MKTNDVRKWQNITKAKSLLSKQLVAVLLLIVIIGVFNCTLQAQSPINQSVTPYQVTISYNKTSNIIFPFAIKSVDRGSSAVLVQKAKGIENILQVKAARENFEETNLSVVTSDGMFYSFIVNYAEQPLLLNLSFVKDSGSVKLPAAVVSAQLLDAASYQRMADSIQLEKGFLHKRVTTEQMQLRLHGIYVYRQIVWFRLQLKNHSMIDFIPSSIRFFVRDKRRGKRTAMQESEITPLFSPAKDTVTEEHAFLQVLAFKAFALAKTQKLIIQVREENGGRLLELKVSYQKLLKARGI